MALESTASRHFARPNPSILVIASTLLPQIQENRELHTMNSLNTLLYSFWRHTGRLAALTLGLLALSLNGFSNEVMYQSVQQNVLRACEEVPIAQQASCKAQYQKDYATYKRERDFLKAS